MKNYYKIAQRGTHVFYYIKSVRVRLLGTQARMCVRVNESTIHL